MTTREEELDAETTERLEYILTPEIVGLFAAADVTELYRTADGRLWRNTPRGREDTGVRMDEGRVTAFVSAVSHSVGEVVTDERPTLRAQLPRWGVFGGARLQVVTPPLVQGSIFCMRKRATRKIPLREMIWEDTDEARGRDPFAERLRALAGEGTPAGEEVVQAAIDTRMNMLVVGGTDSGKTTFARTVMDEISARAARDRILIMEDTPELECAAEDHAILYTADRLEIGFRQLVKMILRLSPDRIVHGEVRGEDAKDLLEALSTGHPGGLATVHAEHGLGGLHRLERLASDGTVSGKSQGPLVGEAIDLVFVLEKAPRGRRVREIRRVHGYNSASQQYLTERLAFKG